MINSYEKSQNSILEELKHDLAVILKYDIYSKTSDIIIDINRAIDKVEKKMKLMDGSNDMSSKFKQCQNCGNILDVPEESKNGCST